MNAQAVPPAAAEEALPTGGYRVDGNALARLEVGCARENVPSGERSELCRGAHAEQNAINFAARFGISIEGATVYTTHLPCSWCSKSIVNAGITRVVYLHDYPDPASKAILGSIELAQLGDFSVIHIE